MANIAQKRHKPWIIVMICILILLVLVGSFCYIVYAKEEILKEQEKIAGYDKLLLSETNWLLETQLSNGAFAFRPETQGEAFINPYFANYTAIALLEAEPSADTVQAVKRYFDWYFSHLNTQDYDYNGIPYTIYDYTAQVEDGKVMSETASLSYDSIDSYAATFLTALWKYYQVSQDASYITEHYIQIAGIISAIFETIEDGLSTAKPDYPVAYLMDNAEVYEGFISAQNLFQEALLPVFQSDTTLLNNAHSFLEDLNARTERLAYEIEVQLWVSQESHYASSQMKGNKSAFDWHEFYPSATSQLFPILTGLLSPNEERSQALYQEFSQMHAWQTLYHYENGEASFYWGAIAYCAALMQDTARLQTYLDYYEQWIQPDHAYPLYNADAAWTVRACQQAKENSQEKISRLDPLHLVALLI